MCGILGGFSRGGVDVLRCHKALELIKHRGPDNQSLRFYSNNNLFLAHARLKILDLSDTANQPFVSSCGNYEIVFNGEIYNFKELRRLLNKEFNFTTDSDTEVLLYMYIKYGVNMLSHLNGMFGFAVYDKKKNVIFLARDRFGIKPLYYFSGSGAFYFASEIKPLLHLTNSAAPNNRMLSTYLSTSHCDFNEDTFFSHINQLAAGHSMVYELPTQAIKINKWYQLGNSNIFENMSDSDIQDLVEDTLSQAVERHLVADVDVGLNISGGVDSAILSHLTTRSLGRCNSYTQNFSGYSEKPWVEQVAEGFSLNTHFADLGPNDIREKLLETIVHQEQPFGGVAVIGYSFLYDMAVKNGTTVLLDGNGVDEIFLGYKKYHIEYLEDNKNSADFRVLLDDYCSFWQEAEDVALGRIKALNKHSSMIDGTAHAGESAIQYDLASLENYEIPTVTSFESSVHNSAARDLLYTKIPRGLRFNDRMSMMRSRELRIPFLDHELVELGYSLPISQLINRSGTKAIVRKILAKTVDDTIAFAPKRSIQTPQNDWLANEYRDLVEDIIYSTSFRDRGWVDVEKAKIAYEQYLLGNKTTSFFIWQWINLELWAKEFFDNRIWQ